MTELKPFQEATVQAVLAAFDRRRRIRRFLVADEVGLGKTVVAQHVIRELMAKRAESKPFVVFYMCSNLTIARQNRRKLLEVLPTEERESADCPVDRLSLLRASAPPQHPDLHLYSLTPDTSIPIRKRHRRDGRKEERALIHALVERLWPRLFKEWGKKVFQGSASVHWKQSVARQKVKASNKALRSAFVKSVREEFQLAEGRRFLAELRLRWEAGTLDELDLIVHLRNALAASAIEEVSPDLVIFDEFQKFDDLLKKQENQAAERVIGRLLGHGMRNPPALLLLSATPYRLFTRRWEEEAGVSHRSEFFELIEVLFGGDGKGSDPVAAEKRKECENAFVQLETELRKGVPSSPDAQQARRAIENLLCPIIARTERASHRTVGGAPRRRSTGPYPRNRHVPSPRRERSRAADRRPAISIVGNSRRPTGIGRNTRSNCSRDRRLVASGAVREVRRLSLPSLRRPPQLRTGGKGHVLRHATRRHGLPD